MNTASTMPAARKLRPLIVLMTRMHATLPMFAAMAEVLSTSNQAPNSGWKLEPGPHLEPPASSVPAHAHAPCTFAASRPGSTRPQPRRRLRMRQHSLDLTVS